MHISTRLSQVPMDTTVKSPLSRRSRVKWYCMSMCRLQSDRTGFSANLIAAVLSHRRVLGTDGISNYDRPFLYQIICLAVSASAMYSASIVEAATERCLHAFQEMV